MELKDIIKESVCISETASFKEAVSKMLTEKTNSLLVTDNNGLLTGEVNVTDLLDAIVPAYLDGDITAAHFTTENMFEEALQNTEEKQVQFFMETDFDTVKIDDGLMTVAAIAIANKRARIPVVDDNNKPVGIVSRQGLKHIIATFLHIPEIK